MRKPPVIALEYMGSLGYGAAWREQLDRAARVSEGERDGFLLIVEHPPVLTVGRRAARGDLGLSAEAWAARGVEVVATDRGGKVTYHGPGQIVAYPVLHLRRLGLDVTRHVRALEETAIRMLASYGIEGWRDPANPGVWVGTGDGRTAKVAALGVHVRRWITTHGIAVNVNVDTAIYRQFNPCGLGDRGVTSIAEITGGGVDFPDATRRFVRAFCEAFGVRVDELRGCA